MTHAVFSELKPAISKPWHQRMTSGWFIALLPLALTLYFAGLIGHVATGEVITASYVWVPSFGVNLSFYVDGLSLVFGLLISGIGTLVVIYSGGYLAGHPQLGRFYLYLLLFMTAMLGLVLSGNIITMFIFWELTSRSSYLLIGFYRRRAEARASALQALLITGLGGLVLLAGLGLLLVVLLEFLPDSLLRPFLATSASAIAAELVQVKLAAWCGINAIFWLSLATLLAGVGLYTGRSGLRRLLQRANGVSAIGPERGYNWALDGLRAVAAGQTCLLQHGYLRLYLLTIVLSAAGLVGYTLLNRYGLNIGSNWSGVSVHEVTVSVVMLLATLAAVVSNSRLATITALGVVGYGLSLLFVFYGAPDLAMTQLAVETLTVIILALTLYHLPRFSRLSSPVNRTRDTLVALAVGGLVFLLALTALAVPMQSRLTPFYAENSATLAKGRNIVNVILVDFRALDTLGEITVLAVAALGIYALLKARKENKQVRIDEEISPLVSEPQSDVR